MDNIIFQDREIWATKEQQYINIHKSGSTTIRTLLEKGFPGIRSYLEPIKDSVAWTVLRDPYERFVDALSYDILRTGLELTEGTLMQVIGDSYKLRQYIFGVSHPETRTSGLVRHSMLQVTYLTNISLDHFILDKDLDIFCSMHFPQHTLHSEDMNMGGLSEQEFVYEFLQKNPAIDSEVRNYLMIDYFLLNQLRAANRQWHWANGRIF